jgi:lincosamide nucleotidyltransferase A/C/D/E
VDEADVTELLARLGQAGLRVWVDGGWGVDALLGAQTRPHSDLDLVVDRPDLEAAQELLVARGYAVLRDWLPNAIAYRDAQGRQVDLHPVDPTPDGGGDQIQLDGRSRWHYSAPVTGVIGGRAVLCCPVDDQVLCHLGYPPRATDFDDMRRLGERFGLKPPEPFASPWGSTRTKKPDTRHHRPDQAR